MRVFLKQHALLLLASLGVLATVLQVLRNDLVWDDVYLVSTIDTGGGFGRLADIVSTPFWSNSSYVSIELADYWRPLTSLVLWLGATAFDKASWGMHLVSVLAMLAAAAGLVRVVRCTPGDADAQRRVGLWLGLLFVAHPLGAEVLCLVSNVADHLAIALLALAISALHGYWAGGGDRRRLWIAGGFGFLACCAKEIGVVHALSPLCAFLLVRAGTTSTDRRALASPGPWIAAFAPVVTYLALRAAVITADGGSADPLHGRSLFPIAFVLGYGQTLLRSIVPIPSGAISPAGPGEVTAIVAAVAAWAMLVAAVAVDLFRQRRLSHASIGALVALALLLPSLAATARVDGVYQFATRYFHLPLAGLLLALVPVLRRRWKRTTEIALATAVALLCLLSWVRIGEWRNDLSFFASEVAYRPGDDEVRVNLAQALCREDAFDAAEEVLGPLRGPGVRFSSPLIEATYMNAVSKIALLRDHDVERAARALERALVLQPENLTIVLMLAEARDRAGRPDQSLIITEKALAAPWFQDHRRAVILKYLDLYRRRAAEAAERKAP